MCDANSDDMAPVYGNEANSPVSDGARMEVAKQRVSE